MTAITSTGQMLNSLNLKTMGGGGVGNLILKLIWKWMTLHGGMIYSFWY